MCGLVLALFGKITARPQPAALSQCANDATGGLRANSGVPLQPQGYRQQPMQNLHHAGDSRISAIIAVGSRLTTRHGIPCRGATRSQHAVVRSNAILAGQGHGGRRAALVHRSRIEQTSLAIYIAA